MITSTTSMIMFAALWGHVQYGDPNLSVLDILTTNRVLPPEEVLTIAALESSFQTCVSTSAEAYGLLQITPIAYKDVVGRVKKIEKTKYPRGEKEDNFMEVCGKLPSLAPDFSFVKTDPRANALVGSCFFRSLKDFHYKGSSRLAAIHYFSGGAGVKAYLNKKESPAVRYYINRWTRLHKLAVSSLRQVASNEGVE